MKNRLLLILGVLILGILGLTCNPINSYLNNPPINPIAALLCIISAFMLFFTEIKAGFNENWTKPLISFFVFAILYAEFWVTFNTFQIVFMPQYVPEGAANTLPNKSIYFPPILGVIGFFLIALRGLLYLFDTNRVKVVRVIGLLVIFISLLSLSGHIFNIPILYSKLFKSGGVAVLTGMSMLLSGIVLFATRGRNRH